MKPMMFRSLVLIFAAVLLAGALQFVAGDADPALARQLGSALLLAAGLASLFAVLRQRLRSEDRILRLEADLCREQSARTQADQALAEADLLLARLTARRSTRDPAATHDPDEHIAAQLSQIQAELAHLQQRITLDAACAARLEGTQARLEHVARRLRNAARAAEPG